MSKSGVLLTGIAALLMAAAGYARAEEAAEPAVSGWEVRNGFLVEIDGPIGPAISAHVSKSLARASDELAGVVVLRIDTPGGLDSSMREIIKAILASPVPVVGYVAPGGARAASAGTYILYATHIAAMAPSTNLGAATPIPIGGGGPPSMPKPDMGDDKDGQDEAGEADDRAPEPADPQTAAARKQVNDAVAYIRSLAERRGRNADWAEKAVREGASLSATEALAQNVIDLVASSTDALLAELDGRQVELNGVQRRLDVADVSLETIETDWRTDLLAIITNPTVAYMLLMIGIYGLILEGYNPGAMVPGVVGAICLLLALFAFQILPVNTAGFALMLLGIALMVAEALAPSFGILGFGGIVAFVAGSIILMDSDVPGYEVPLGAIGAIGAAASGLMVMTMWLLMRSRRKPVVTGVEAMQGAEGEAVMDFEARDGGYAGLVHLKGENWQAECAEPVARGQAVRVLNRQGLKLRVEPGSLSDLP